MPSNHTPSLTWHRGRTRPLSLLILFLVLIGLGCDRQGTTAPPSPVAASQAAAVEVSEIERKVAMDIGGQTFILEVAATDADRQRGLMHRKSMAADRGMIFIFPEEARRSFWMRNTLIPLDIIYVDAFGKVVHVAQMKPLDETGTPSGWPAKYAIELNEGTAKRLNVVPGNMLRIPTDARHTSE